MYTFLKLCYNLCCVCTAVIILLHLFHVDSSNSFRVFDREADGEAYASVRKHILMNADVNILGQPKLLTEPQVRHCPGYTHFLHGDVRVSLNFTLIFSHFL